MFDGDPLIRPPSRRWEGFSPLAERFSPDLIVEVTSVCDRKCPGCYSPTLRTTDDLEETFRARPELFLDARTLSAALAQLPEMPGGIALRGGEPSRHPALESLIVASRRFSARVWVETHARWLLEPDALGRRWLAVLRDTGSIVKISFDRMHALRREQLEAVCETLGAHGVDWIIAITEPTLEKFSISRQACAWVDDDKVVFQEKVTDHRLLVQPRLGTLDVGGSLQRQPTAKLSLRVVEA
ncbi:hypothetical protein G6O69_19860 [Pseudenhygromyxa sp. WMMC2535]|uniref:hypothetical protein n=1 Tax=Pseudenhygromyxa sp. WMMC2535 TaxID=2712867 RepID=UPI0015529EDF|nr:hypothetical protein [Pseudenhygromyxa sp. WMMC2535]NVB40112.1 hypothetical protein [Pseudenhygromyxa sp. WMMC2535]